MGKRSRQIAARQLRKYEDAGRIMETDAGVVSSHACRRCRLRGTAHECKVYADGRLTPCALCVRTGKGGCTASVLPTEDEYEIEAEDAIKYEEYEEEDEPMAGLFTPDTGTSNDFGINTSAGGGDDKTDAHNDILEPGMDELARKLSLLNTYEETIRRHDTALREQRSETAEAKARCGELEARVDRLEGLLRRLAGAIE